MAETDTNAANSLIAVQLFNGANPEQRDRLPQMLIFLHNCLAHKNHLNSATRDD